LTVSIAAKTTIDLSDDAPRFPAVLDTGNNHNFAIRQDQLARWTGLSLPKRGLINVGGRTIPLYAANVWIHADSGTSFCLWMEEGIAIYPPDVANPARLPILGLRRLLRNGLRIVIDGKKLDIAVDTS
jgi:hypothetical protein